MNAITSSGRKVDHPSHDVPPFTPCNFLASDTDRGETEDSIQVLINIFQAQWKKRGYEVHAWPYPIYGPKGGLIDWSFRSELVNGLPPFKKPQYR